MISSHPWHQSTILLHPLSTVSAFDSPFFLFPSNSIQLRKFNVFAAAIKEKHNLYELTSSRNVEKLESLKRNGGRIRTITEFNHLLFSLISSDDFESALKLKSSLSSLGLLPDNSTYSIMVNGFCKNNEAVEARSILQEMLDNGFHPNVAIFTTVINSFCERGRLREAYQVFDIMSKIGCQPTINTYNCLLKGLCYVGRVEEAYDLLTNIKKSSIKPDTYTYTAMMDGFCKVGRSKEALELLDEALEMELTPNVVMYNTLFNGNFKEGKPLLGFNLLKLMRKMDCRPDYISYSTLLHGLLKWGETKEAFLVYKEMVRAGYRVDERMMNTLLRGLCRQTRKEKEVVDDAFNVFEEMRNRSYAIYQDGYELVVEALCNGRDTERVYEALNEMIEIGFSPKTFTFNIAIHALCCGGDIDKAVAILMLVHKDRKARGIPFNVLIGELNRRGRVMEAGGVYGLALKRGVVPKREPELDTL